jgi:hypothetical protein
MFLRNGLTALGDAVVRIFLVPNSLEKFFLISTLLVTRKQLSIDRFALSPSV